MKRFSRRFLIMNGSLLAVLGVLVYLGVGTLFPGSSASADTGRTLTVTDGTVSTSVSASGSVSADTVDDLASTGSGDITAVKVAAGDTVTKGEVVATVDPTTSQEALQSAQIQLESAQQTLTDAQDYGGETEQQRAADNYSLEEQEDTVSTDETAVTTAKDQLAADESACTASADVDGSSGDIVLTAALRSDAAASDTTTTTTATGTSTDGTSTTSGSSSSDSSSTTSTTTNSGCSAETSDESAVTQAENTLTQAEDSLEATNLSNAAKYYISPSTLASDELAVTEDQATVSEDQAAVAGTTIVSPIAGTVTAVDESVGDDVTGSSGTTSSSSDTSSSDTSSTTDATSTSTTASSTGSTGSTASTGDTSSSSSTASSGGTTIVVVSNLSDLEVVAGFAESDASKIAVGQAATVTLDASTSDTSITGKVTTVSDSSTTDDDVVEYDETIALVDPPSTVEPGMTATVAVTTESKSDVLELPTAAITTTGATSTVTLVKDGKKSTRTVTVGLVGDTTSQITSGLAAGDEVIEPVAKVSSSTDSSSSGSSSDSGSLGDASSGFTGGGATGGGGGGGFGGGAP